MIKITKRLENKYFVDSLKEERILNCEDGYRLVTITVRNCAKSEGVKLSELLIELYSEEVTMYLYDYEYYDVHDEFFEFQVCVDDEMIKEFNELYSEFKNSAEELLLNEAEKEEAEEEAKEEIKAEVEEDQKEEETKIEEDLTEETLTIEEAKKIIEEKESLSLKQLAKKTQDLLEEGCAIIYVWKIGKSWKYAEFWYDSLDDDNNYEYSLNDQMLIDSIMKADKAATSFNGYEEFGSYTLKYIENRYKYGYLRSQREIRENELTEEFINIEKSEKEEIKEDNQTFLESEIEFWNDEVEEDRKEEKTNFKFLKTSHHKDWGNDGYRLITITVENCNIESYKELLDDLLKSASHEAIHCYKYDDIDEVKKDNVYQSNICVDENELRSFNKIYYKWVVYWTELDTPENREDIVKGVLYNTSTEQNKKEAKYKIGQILYNCGDMANVSGWYKIINVIIDKFGIFYDVEEIAGDRKNHYHEVFISEVDKNNGSTRIVTKEAREALMGTDYVKRQLDSLLAKMDPIKKDEIKDIDQSIKDKRIELSIVERNNIEDEKNSLINNIVKRCNFGIEIERKIQIYFNRLNNEKRSEFINKFQKDKKDSNINLFYYTVFADIQNYNDINVLRMLKLKIDKYVDIICNFKNLLIEEVNKDNKKLYKYTYISRGFSIGCQPMNGLVDHKNEDDYKFEVLTYDRELNREELYRYELYKLGEERA